jgi:hypothetical protein
MLKHNLNRLITENENAEEEFEDLEDFLILLNEDGILSIGDYAFKIDFTNERVYTLPVSLLNNEIKYNNLKNGIYTDVEIGVFDFDDNVLDAIEEGITTTENLTDETLRFFCWHRRGAQGKSYKRAYYFKDPVWLESTIGLCANATHGLTSNTRLKVKLEYFRAGIYFTLFLKSKHQRETATNVNGDPYFHTTPWDYSLGTQDWETNYKVAYRGKCRNQPHRSETGKIRPSLNGNSNKARRVFWESDNGLNYYALETNSTIHTMTIWKGEASEIYFCTNSSFVLNLSAPTKVNTYLHVHPYEKDMIRSNY